MSTKMASGNLTEVKIEHKRRHTQGPETHQITKISKVSTMSQPEFYNAQTSEFGGKKLKSDFVYVNSAYVGSVDNVNNNERHQSAPPTSVIREQYWACSRWPYTQRFLALAVGVLLGTVIGLIVVVIFRGTDQDIMPGFLMRNSAPD